MRRAAIDTHGFRFAKLLDYRDVMFLPGGAKYGDVPALLALSSPGELWVAGEGKGSEVAQSAFAAANAKEKLQFDAGEASSRLSRAVDWLLK